MTFLLGRLEEGNKNLLEAYRLAQHFGHRGFVRWCEGGPLLGSLYQRGQWDEVVERADAFLASLGGEGHYQAGSSHLFRGSIRAARGDDAGAVEDAARALELSRPVGDPQLSGTTLLGAAFIYMTVGDAATARTLFDESLAFIGELGQLGWVVIELHSLAWVGRKLERSDEVLAAVKDEPLQSPWLLAGRAVAEGDFVRAANIFGEVGDVTAEAFYRLCAAQALAAQGRRSEVDPEDVEAILRPYHERLRYELERWGGTVEKFIGDAVMALFGAPVTREDDPERAVRAALSIRDWIAEEGELQVRIAVNTGEALVNLTARPDAGEGMAAGDVVNTAARLQSAAPVNGILVGETTYRATAETIEFREHDRDRGERQGAARCRLGGGRGTRTLRCRPRTGDADAARRTRARGRLARRHAREDTTAALDGARNADRRPGHRQEPPRRRAVPVDRTRRRADVLAAGTFAAVRRGSQLLGARRDGESAGRHPRDGQRRRSGGEARARRRAAGRRGRGLGAGTPASARRAGRRRHRAHRTRRSQRGAASSKRSPKITRSSSSSRICSGPTRACSTSSSISLTGCEMSRC